MSLGRLLATGKSLVGGQDATSRYRMSKQLRLPKFVSPRNPFATEAKTEAASAHPVQPEQNQPAPETTAPLHRSVVSPQVPKSAVSSPALGDNPGDRTATKARPTWKSALPQVWKSALRNGSRAEPSKLAGILERLVLVSRRLSSKANPFSRFGKATRPKKSAIPHFAKTPVQSELCLDKVQVVRNDLSDADLEVVPIARPVAMDEAKRELATAGKCESAGNSWGRLTTRIFGSTQT